MRRFLGIVLVAGMGLAAVPAGAGEAGTPCTFEVDLTLSPGLSRNPSSGTFDSKGESGQLDCQGSMGGQPVTGRGTFGAEGRYGTDGDGDDCRSREGRGEGTGHFTVPVDGGSRHVDDPFTMTYRVDGRSVVGQITGQRFSGAFDVTKANGDCFWHAITRIHIKGKGRLQPEQQPDPAPAPVPIAP